MKKTIAKKPTLKRRKKLGKFKAACLAVGLSTAWAGDAGAGLIEFRGSFTPTRTIQDAVIYYFNGVTSAHFFKLGMLPANQTTTIEHSIFLSFDNGVVLDTSFRSPGYVIAGWYEDDAGPGVTVSFPNNSPIDGSQTWDDVFSTNVPFAPSHVYTEAEVLEILQAGEIPSGFLSTYEDYFDATIPKRLPYLITHFNQEATLINFSVADFGGTAIVEVVPEPSTLILLVCAAGVLFVVPRKKAA